MIAAATVVCTTVMAQNTITQQVYWLDGNVSTAQTVGATVDISGLMPGLHSFSIRVKDSNGLWSSVVTKYFVIPSATESSSVAVARYMYWIDGNVANYMEGTVTGSAIEIDFSALSEGTHTLSWRVSDTKGAWGPVKTETFTYSNLTAAGDWNVAANWNTGEVPAAITDVTIAADITIPSGYIANANNITIADGGSLTIEDGGQLIHSNTVNVTTEKNPEKATNWGEPDPSSPYIPDGWYFIASPADGASFSTVTTGDYDLYLFDNENSQWFNQKNQEHAALFANGFQRGTGYLYATNESNVTLQFSGEAVPYDPTYTIPLEAGWNLVGNPFTRNVVPNKSYLTLVNAASTTAVTAGSGEITPGMGIAVYSETSGTLGFTLPVAVSSAPSNDNLQITLSQVVTTRGKTSTTMLDNAIVSFSEGENQPKFSFLEGGAKIYIPQDGKDYSIAYSDRQGEMPVCFKAAKDGQYTITVNTEGVDMDYLHLIDNIAGTDIDLFATSSYSFNAKADDYESRFRLVFSANSENEIGNEDFAFFSNGQLIVTGEGTLHVVDMLGRMLVTKQLSTTNSQLPTSNFHAGVYVLRLINGENVKTQKIVVNKRK